MPELVSSPTINVNKDDPNNTQLDVKTGVPVGAEVLLSSQNLTNVVPTGIGYANNVQVKYGAAFGTLSDPVMIDADGTVTFNEAGTYFLSFYFQFTRTGNSGTANLVLWSLFDDVTAGIPVISKAFNQNILTPAELTIPITVPAGIELKGRIMRDTSGANDGELGAYIVTDTSGGLNGPTNGASASLIIYRMATA